MHRFTIIWVFILLFFTQGCSNAVAMAAASPVIAIALLPLKIVGAAVGALIGAAAGMGV